MDVRAMALLAGSASTTLFVVSYLPMLVRAVRTRDLRSYSRSSLVIANVGNVVQAGYVISLPVGSAVVPARVLPRRERADAHPPPPTRRPSAGGRPGGPATEPTMGLGRRLATATHPPRRDRGRAPTDQETR